jgi:predicted AAA+ superfamily ATPase
MIQRHLEGELVRWKQVPDRLPLVIRGARQVGKSTLIEHFGKTAFERLITVNFEIDTIFKSCFESLDPIKIISALEVITNTSIEPGKTLIFFDEIQECPQAIVALRYFKEKMHQLHIIAAGSLLEFCLNEEQFSFPVGRIQFLFLKPLSFCEFLNGLGETKSLEVISQATLFTPLALAIHEHLASLFALYCRIGGMPAAVNAYLNSRSLLDVKRVHQTLLQTYQHDFGKYATKTQVQHLQRLYEKAPFIVSSHFKFAKIDPQTRSRDLKIALRQLTWAGLLFPVHQTHASGLPLKFQSDETKFKLLFLDCGLMQTATGANIELVQNAHKNALNLTLGAVAEQVVGQELLAYQDPYEPPSCFFWKRDAKSSTAEVDYLFAHNSNIFPIEVKAGTTGHFKSLLLFLQEKNQSLGITISLSALQLTKPVLCVPFYLISRLAHLLDESQESTHA